VLSIKINLPPIFYPWIIVQKPNLEYPDFNIPGMGGDPLLRFLAEVQQELK